MKTKIFKNRKQALKFKKKVDGELTWYQKPSLRRFKSKTTGKMVSRPIIKTFFKVTYY